MKQYHVYILTNKKRGVLYIGVTNDLVRRVQQHRDKVVPGFASRYNLVRLVYYESTGDVYSAIQREKQLKGWLRAKKISLIESQNPSWDDLAVDLTG